MSSSFGGNKSNSRRASTTIQIGPAAKIAEPACFSQFHSGEIVKSAGRIGVAQILSDGPKPRQRATPTKGMSVSKARERAAQMEAELQTPSPPPAKKVVANASMRRFRTAREMQQQIDSIQQELDATKDYYAEVMTALQTEQERVDFQDKRLLELKQKSLVASRIIQRLLKENQVRGDGEGAPEVTDSARKDAAKLLDVLHKSSTTANPGASGEPIDEFFNNPDGNITEYIQTKMEAVMASVSADTPEDEGDGKPDGEPGEPGEGKSSTNGESKPPSPRPGGS